MKKNIPIMNDDSEIVRYNNINIPYYVAEGRLFWFDNHKAICHWHNDFEIIRIISGHMHYYIDGKEVLLNTDDILLVNSERMHYGYGNTNADCHFVCYLINPMLLACNNSFLYEKIIQPIIHCGITHWILDNQYPAHQSALSLLDTIFTINNDKTNCYEFQTVHLFHSFIYEFYTTASFVIDGSATSVDQTLLRKMILYIHQNYKYDIQIEDIANSINVSRTTCCKLFRTISSTPIQFLNQYRLELAYNLIIRSEMNITTIAHEVGFNDSGYFTRRFKLKYGISPKE